jgi:hypothetical protein
MKYVVEMRLRHSDVDGGTHRHTERMETETPTLEK